MLEELIKKAQAIQDEAFMNGDVAGFFSAGEDIQKYQSLIDARNAKLEKIKKVRDTEVHLCIMTKS